MGTQTTDAGVRKAWFWIPELPLLVLKPLTFLVTWFSHLWDGNKNVLLFYGCYRDEILVRALGMQQSDFYGASAAGVWWEPLIRSCGWEFCQHIAGPCCCLLFSLKCLYSSCPPIVMCPWFKQLWALAILTCTFLQNSYQLHNWLLLW